MKAELSRIKDQDFMMVNIQVMFYEERSVFSVAALAGLQVVCVCVSYSL